MVRIDWAIFQNLNFPENREFKQSDKVSKIFDISPYVL